MLLKAGRSVLGHRFSDAESFSMMAAALRAGVLLASIFAASLSTSAFAEPGAATYKAHCSACHGAKGAADSTIGKSMNLRPLGSAEVQHESDEEIFNIISKGIKKRMPAFDNKLSKEQIHELVRYLRSFIPSR
jgi:mono/diheme cytochrome c family protein